MAGTAEDVARRCSCWRIMGRAGSVSGDAPTGGDTQLSFCIGICSELGCNTHITTQRHRLRVRPHQPQRRSSWD